MADIDVRRLRAIDGVAPQHKKAGEDEFEFTEGSGGALHTKDVDVLAELESIKQQQQQILQRLDEPIDTQLTGSNVELIKEHLNSTALIGAGSVRYFADSIGGGAQTNPVDVRRYNKVIIKVRNGHNEQVVVRIFSYKELHKGSGSGVNRVFQIGSEEPLPAGSEKIFSSVEYPELSLPHIGISVQLTNVSADATGDVDVIYIGGV